mmetsp:Transcript_103625/g.237273  ORF Transcript_103625/g.237273 Transcript_103625/m.237273 type:complete len:213 (-) Transcript_103625:336-974(-)
MCHSRHDAFSSRWCCRASARPCVVCCLCACLALSVQPRHLVATSDDGRRITSSNPGGGLSGATSYSSRRSASGAASSRPTAARPPRLAMAISRQEAFSSRRSLMWSAHSAAVVSDSCPFWDRWLVVWTFHPSISRETSMEGDFRLSKDLSAAAAEGGSPAFLCAPGDDACSSLSIAISRQEAFSRRRSWRCWCQSSSEHRPSRSLVDLVLLV